MRRRHISRAGLVLALTLWIAGCAPAAPAPTPTKAPAAPTKAAEPTKAPAAPTKAAEPTKATAQPTAAPAKKVDFPQKGKPITMIVPWDPGGGTDVAARLMAAALEKQLDVPVQIVNKPGAGGQVGTQELVRAKPDGYTLGYTNIPTLITVYLDPERKAGFGRKDMTPIANQVWTLAVTAVAADSPFKSLKDVVDAAKANPEKVKAATPGIMTINHVEAVMLEKAAGIKFALVHFSGAAPQATALAGGHVDVAFTSLASYAGQIKSGQGRAIGIMDKNRSDYTPNTMTYEEQGYKLYSGNGYGISGPAGVPNEIVGVLSDAVKRAMATDELKKKMAEVSLDQRFIGGAEYGAFWDDWEAQIKQLMAELTKRN